MKVFLSWSGDTSREIAAALHDWLPLIIQAVRPFMSTVDIEKGSRWNEALEAELNTAYGIVCITKSNLTRPWIYYEAGAISKAITRRKDDNADDEADDKAYVVPFLFGVDPSLVREPLKKFQVTKYDEHDVFRLLQDINSKLGPEQVSPEVLDKEFKLWWPELVKTIKNIKKDDGPATEYPWLYTTPDLANALADNNETFKCKCVWFVTPNVENVLRDDVRKAIQGNIDAGIIYKFLIPKDDNYDTNAEGLNDITAPAGKLLIVPLEKEFSYLAVTDYIIMHPSSGTVQVFLELPLNGPEVYWIKVTDMPARQFETRFSYWLDDEKTSAAPPAGHEDSSASAH